MTDLSDNINIILVNTSHPGNVGSIARAMKTMGLKRLSLVNPCALDGKANAMAVGADEIFEQAKTFTSLEDAIADCQVVVATTARMRRIEWPQLSPEQCAKRLYSEAANGQQVAVVFGRESSGLTNEELDLCHFLVNIPSVEGFSSLNIAAAVQIISYEIRLQMIGEQPDIVPDIEDGRLATSGEFEGFMQHLISLLDQVEFINQKASTALLRRIRRIFTRIGLNIREINILRGMISAIESHIHRQK